MNEVNHDSDEEQIEEILPFLNGIILQHSLLSMMISRNDMDDPKWE